MLSDGVAEGRRIFANTIKSVLMGTSSNFGNMFSASVASVVLPFLQMLPGQILLDNLLYDTGQLAIPSDRVDPEQVQTPSHWDIGFIRRFMLLFGPISSLFDFATFALMMLVFHAAEAEFQAGWFIESNRHPDADHLRHPHPPGSVLPQPSVARIDPRLARSAWFFRSLTRRSEATARPPHPRISAPRAPPLVPIHGTVRVSVTGCMSSRARA